MNGSFITSFLKRSGRKALSAGMKTSLALRPENIDDPESEQLNEMSFLDHLEELRWSLIKGGSGVLLVTIIVAFFKKQIIEVILLGPAKPDFIMYKVLRIDALRLSLQNRTIPGQFFVDWGTVMAVGLIIGSPVFVYFLWKFIEPGLYKSERKGLRLATAFGTFFFILGILFGYLILTPIALQFFAHYTISDQVVNDFDITRYFSMITWWAFGAGLLFELPVIVYFLAKIGLLTDELMIKYRRYALIIIMILSAFFTPPDPLSMVIVAIPLVVLYQFSIWIAKVVGKKREKEMAESLS